MHRLIAAAVCAMALSACAGAPKKGEPAGPSMQWNDQAVPAGPVGNMVRYGHELFTHTREHLRPYVTAEMDCSACHVKGGTVPRGGNLVGIYAQFPQWNKRAKRVISLQDRLAECFLYSMNGHPPPYQSREMEAMVAYIAYLSRGAPVGSKPEPAAHIAHFNPPQPPDAKHGRQLYTQRCSVCHGAGGDGHQGAFPPLWGSKSFNSGAGMHRLWTMAGFVRYNMPQNAPGTLTDQQSYDVAAYVLSHARPSFDKKRAVMFPPQAAGYF